MQVLTLKGLPQTCVSPSQPLACQSIQTILPVQILVTTKQPAAICYILPTMDLYIFITYVLPAVHKKH